MDSDIEIPKEIESVLEKLQKAGYEAFAVGGCVRDTFLRKVPHDWDIATSARPAQIKEVFCGFKQIDTGLKHGTVTVVTGFGPIEITTYRIDGSYSDGRRPDNVTFTSDITQDLARRDFTINACAVNKTCLIDPFGGKCDAQNRLIRCVGDPQKRFTEDALRILRAIRFASALDFSVEQKTKEAMVECKALLKNVSQERVTAELSKTLLGKGVKRTLLEFSGIIAFICPEIKAMIGFEQHNRYHIYDVYRHTLTAVEIIDSDLVLRTTMFFHDIAKPSCFFTDKKGIGHFYGHPEKSAAMAQAILKRMKFSSNDTKEITELIKYHDAPILPTPKSVKKMLGRLGETQFSRLLKVKRADILAQSPVFSKDRLEDLAEIERLFGKITADGSCFSLSGLALNGNDLIALGIPKGKRIGQTLEKLLSLVIEEKIENKKDVLLEKARLLYLRQ